MTSSGEVHIGPAVDTTSLQPSPTVTLITEHTPLLSRTSTQVVEDDWVEDNTKLSQMIWEECITLVRYAIPVFGTQILEFSMILASVISIGHLSTVALASATIGFMTANVTGLSIIHGLANTLDTVLPSAWTSDKPELVGLWTQRMVVLSSSILIPIYFIWFNAESLLLFLRQEPEVAKLASIYLRWTSLGLPAYALGCIARRYFQAQGLFAVPTRIILVVAPINITLNYLLVWGPAPIRLGFIGAPIASAISYNLTAIAMVIYGKFFVDKKAWHPLSSKAFTSLWYLGTLSLGSIGQVVSEWWSWELVGLAASFFGPVPLASQSILLNTIATAFQAPFALSIAASVRIGNLLGETNYKRARTTANVSIVFGLSLAALFSAVIFTFRRSWAYLFNDDPEVVALVASVLPIISLVEFVDFLNGVTAGILRARGQQMVGAGLNVCGYYLIGLPVGFFLAFRQELKLAGLWWGIVAGTAFASIVAAYLCIRTDWKEEVRKVLARLAMDKADPGRLDSDEEGRLYENGIEDDSN